VSIGFTSTIPTRLALGINPVTPMNINEAFDIYKWARPRNIYAIVTPTMISGRQKGNTWKKNTPSAEELFRLYANIYKYNISVNLATIDGLRADGISAYAGGHPCNQVAAGLYITLNGVVLSCPGSETNVEGNIWQSSLETIWLNSMNYTRRGTFNCHCIAKDGKSIPSDLYQRVAQELRTDSGNYE
jgi:MoaA/NifB/PqqE/SkfB family radical SAM enzyme